MGKINTAGVLRLRAPSAVSYDQSVRRSAQDDGFVGRLKKNTQTAQRKWEVGLGLNFYRSTTKK
jgi:hypothetical protein